MLIDVHAAALQLSGMNTEKSPLFYGYLLLCFLSWLSPKKTSSVYVRELSTEHSNMFKSAAHHDPSPTMTTLNPE